MTANIDHLYRHFKGKTYIVLHVGEHTETKESLVVYREWRGNPTGKVWIRPKKDFEGSTNGVPRFKVLGYAYPMPESPDEW